MSNRIGKLTAFSENVKNCLPKGNRKAQQSLRLILYYYIVCTAYGRSNMAARKVVPFSS